MWAGETVFILGGGPSLARIDCASIKGGLIIALNNAYLLRPDADMLYFADRRWYRWNKDDLHRFTGNLIVSRSFIPERDGGSRVRDIKWIGRALDNELSREPDQIAGWCSGSNAVNIAFLAGAARVVLLGFDMTPGNWHRLHKEPQNPSQFATRFLPSIEKIGQQAARAGMGCINATPGSALTAFPMADPADFGIMQASEVQEKTCASMSMSGVSHPSARPLTSI
jgi:hypothetical protein